MNNIILEKSSINDSIVTLANAVCDEIIKRVENGQKLKSKITYSDFIHGSFQYKIENFLKGGNILTVNYTIYLVENEFEYHILVRDLGDSSNSEADSDTNTIRIVSGFIYGKPSSDLYETIYHELTHMYQYGMGMTRRNDLYDKAQELSNKGENDIDACYVGYCTYYSFKHEQDAFVHQFYAYLTNNGKRDKFEVLSNGFPYYEFINNEFNTVIKYQNKPQMIKAMNYLGYDKKSFIELIKYRKKRFNAKMYNAYKRYIEDSLPVNEHTMDFIARRISKIILENYEKAKEIKWGLESIYNFNLNY